MKTMKVRPEGGWGTFSRSKELIEAVFRLSQNSGWHYMGLTRNTMVVEAPQSGSTIYLEVDDEKVLEAVISQREPTEDEFKEIVVFLIREFQFTETE